MTRPKQLANTETGPVVSVIRVPGGRASLAIKALAGMQAVLGSGTILVIHHTGKLFEMQPSLNEQQLIVVERLRNDTCDR